MNQMHFERAVSFGETLIKTGDLDPVYIALARSGANQDELARIIVAYSCNYHLSSASFIAQSKGEKFWDKLETAADNFGLKWPRGSERRHWRGSAATESVAYLRNTFRTPEALVAFWATRRTCGEVFKAVQTLPYFGPWIAFKIADLLDRVMQYGIDFSEFELGVYSEPRKGAALIKYGDTEAKVTDFELRRVVEALRLRLRKLKAPPNQDRLVNVQEIETVLCKYKSHVGGHYPLGKDTLEVFHGLRDERFQCVRVRAMLDVIEPMTRVWPYVEGK